MLGEIVCLLVGGFSDHEIQTGSCEKSCTAAVHARMPCAAREIVLLRSTMIACTHEESVVERLLLAEVDSI